MEPLKFKCELNCKEETPFYLTAFVAKDLKDAETKGADLAKNFKTTDQALKDYIKQNAPVVSTVTQLN